METAFSIELVRAASAAGDAGLHDWLRCFILAGGLWLPLVLARRARRLLDRESLRDISVYQAPRG